jgi:hypothetical protein
MLTASLFAFESAAVKVLAKTFSKSTISSVAKHYGDDGLNALQKLSSRYGKEGLKRLESYSVRYGKEGITILSRYGEKALANKTTFEMVKKFGDKGYYLVRQYPARSVKYYEQYGNTFVKTANKVGDSRMMRYMDGAAKYGKEDKVLKFMDKYGEKGNAFLDKHWGKLLTSGFVLFNAESLVDSAKNVANHTVDKGSEVVEKGVKDIANSQLGWFLGITLLLFVFFKFGVNALIEGWRKYRDGSGNNNNVLK